MSEPLAERLSRFTPNAAELDRDALLFAAGRASVRLSRFWPALAAGLAVAQLLTVICLWPRTAPPSPGPSAAPFAASEPLRVEPLPARSSEVDPSALRALRQRMQEADLDYPVSPSDEPMAPPGPPLHAFGKPPASLLN